MTLLKKVKPGGKKKLCHMFDATREQTEIPSIGLDRARPIINQMHLSLWGNSSLQSLPYPRQFDLFSGWHYMPHPRCQQLQWQNSINCISLEPNRDQEMKVGLKSDCNREAVAAVALMNLASHESAGQKNSIHY